MANQAQGQVVSIQGMVKAIAADGSIRQLKAGDVILAGERIELAQGAALAFSRPDGQLVNLDGGRTVLLAEETLLPNAVDASEARIAPLNAEAERVIAALNNNQDPLNVLEETAAGLTGGGANDGGFGFVRLERVVEALNPLSLERQNIETREIPRIEGAQGGVAAEAGLPPDTTAPTISVIAPDNSNDSTPTITGQTDAPVGSTVTLVVTDAAGNKQTLTTTVKPDGSYSVDVKDPLAEGGYKAEASVTDPAGNKGNAQDNGSVDTTAPTITVEAPDNTQDTTPTLSGKTDAPVGSTVTLVVTDAAGNKQTLTTTVKPDGSYSVDVKDPLAEGSYQAEASVTDPAGNKGNAQDNGSVDTNAPKISVEIVNDGNNDGWLNDKEAADGQAQVRVTVDDASLQAGGQVTLTIDRGGNPETRVVTVKFVDGVVQFTDGQGNKLTGYTYDKGVIRFNEGVLAEGEQLKVDAVQTDAAGNQGMGSDSAKLDVAAPTPTVEITEDKNDDGTIDRTEISGKVNVEVKLPAGAVAGDTLKVSGQPDRVLTADDISAGKVGYEYDRPADGGKLDVTATLTDQAGNVSPEGKDSAVMGDTTATVAPTVEITEDKNDDGTIDRTEISGKVNVEVKLPAGAVAGDTLKVSGQPDRVLTADDISAGKVGYEYDRPADGGKLDVTATLTDKAGNVSPEGKDSAVMGDTTVPTVGNTIIGYAENQAAGAPLGNIGATDDKAVTGIVFKDTGTNVSADGYYQINANGDVVLTDKGSKAGVNDFEQGPNSGNYVVVVSDAAGNKTEATITLKETDVNEAPTTSGGYAAGSEDAAFVLQWGQFNAVDVDAGSSLSIKITSLPADGQLLFNGSAVTQAQLNAGLTISKADIEAGKLQFKPDLHESSTTAGTGSSVGNKADDYASFNYQVSDGTNLSTTGKFVVDINAVADKPGLTLGDFQTLASINFEDVNLGNKDWSADIKINSVQGASTVGVWNTLNSGGKVEVGTEKTYTGGSSTNKVMEIEANAGDKTLYTDIDCEAGRFYQLGFDIAARLGSPDTSDMTIKLVRLDAAGNPVVGSEKLLYNFDPTNSNWLRDQKITLPVDASGKYRLIFEAVNADSTGAILDNLKFQAVDNKGYEDSFIKLSAINASFADQDGSETHSVVVSGLQPGSVLKDGVSGHVVTVGVDGTVNVTGWSLGTLQVKPPLNFSGNMNLTVTATATENSNQNSSSTELQLKVEVLPVNDAPVVVSGSAVVSEEGLDNGLADTVGTPNDQTDSKTASGKLAISDAEGDALSVVLKAPVGLSLTSGGQTVSWTGGGTQTLTAMAGGNAVATITIDNSGKYTVTLNKPFDHASGNGENHLSFDVGVQASAGGQTSSGGKLTVVIEDDSPRVSAQSHTLTVGSDLISINDLDAGFVNDVYKNGTNTVERNNTDSHDTLNDQIKWGDPTGSNKSGYTLVDNTAFTTTDGAVIEAGEVFKLADFTHSNYSINGDSSTLKSTDIKLDMDVVINGVSTRVSFTAKLTHTETSNSGSDPRDIITLPAQTVTVNIAGLNYQVNLLGFKDASGNVVNTIYTNESASNSFGIFGSVIPTQPPYTVSGDLLTEGGADGAYVKSVVIDGVSYSYDVKQDSLTVSGGTSKGTFNTADNTLTVKTALGGSFLIDLDNGEYTYAAPTNLQSPANENIGFMVSDFDGDTASSTVSIDLTAAVVTRMSSTSFSGDTGVDKVIGTASGDAIGGGGGADVLNGMAGNDTLNGGDGNDLLIGGTGNDKLNGGDGNDLLIGGTGNDTLTGGLGVDTFKWTLGDQGASAASKAVDTITDFNKASVAAGGDVLDLRDLLQGENHTTGIGNLTDYLHFTKSGSDTVIDVKHLGAAGDVTQQIVLQGVDLTTLGNNDAAILQNLLNDGKLQVD